MAEAALQDGFHSRSFWAGVLGKQPTAPAARSETNHRTIPTSPIWYFVASALVAMSTVKPSELGAIATRY